MSSLLVGGSWGFSGTGLQSPKPLGGFSFSFLAQAAMLKVGLGPAKLPLRRAEGCWRLQRFP